MRHLVTLVTIVFLLVPSVFAQKASIEGLGHLQDTFFNLSYGNAVSSDGSVVVGISTSEHEGAWTMEAYRWEDGEMTGLGFLSGENFFSNAYGVSADGTIVVGLTTSDTGDPNEAFRWENGEMTGLGTLEGHVESQALGISADGSVIAGISSSGPDGGSEAFRWEDGKMEGLGFLPGGSFSTAWGISADGSVIVGESDSPEGVQAAFWDADGITALGVLPGDDFASMANAASADGSVIVGMSSSANATDSPPFGGEGFRWKDGVMEPLGDLPGGSFWSNPQAVSADGSIVVGFSGTEDEDGWPTFRAFIWTEERGMQNLMTVLEEEYDLDLGGWILDTAYGISPDGKIIVGVGFNPNGDSEAWKVTLPYSVSGETSPQTRTAALTAPSPNPVRRTARLTLTVDREQRVTVEVFDLVGRRIQSLYEGSLVAGATENLSLDASRLPSGVYVIRALGEDFLLTQRVTVIR